jgi:hypothetical protein
MNPERLIAASAALLLIVAFAWFLTSDPQIANPGVPTFNGPVLRGLYAEVPVVGPFKTFNVNDMNPFVPWAQSVAEANTYKPKPTRTITEDQPKPPRMRPPRPPAVPVEPPPVVVTLPKLTPAAATAPQCVGLVGAEGEQMVVVRMPGADGTVSWAPGTTVLGWTLISIDNSNQATFTDPTGAIMVFPIGDGDLALAQTLVNPSIDAPPPKTKPGEGALLKPMLTFPTVKPPGGKAPEQGANGNGPRRPKRPAPGGGGVQPGVPTE